MTAADTKEPVTRKALLAFLNTHAAKAAIVPMLPEGVPYERIVREVMNATADNPDILKCTPDSIINAISRAVVTDLEIGTGVFLVPRKDRQSDPQPKLRHQIGYRGKIELMLRFRVAKFIDYHCVYEAEFLGKNGGFYQIEFGTNPFITHKPIRDPEKRGPLVGAYAWAEMGPGRQIIVEMDCSEIDAIRQKYSVQWKTETIWENGEKRTLPLVLDKIPWYAEARVVHRLSKKVPMRGKLATLLAEGDGDEAEIEAVEAPAIARREIGPGSAEPIRAAGGPGLEEVPIEREPAAADHEFPF